MTRRLTLNLEVIRDGKRCPYTPQPAPDDLIAATTDRLPPREARYYPESQVLLLSPEITAEDHARLTALFDGDPRVAPLVERTVAAAGATVDLKAVSA